MSSTVGRVGSATSTTVSTDAGSEMVEVPLALPPVVIGMAWHPRHAADGAHRWLRSAVRRALRAG